MKPERTEWRNQPVDGALHQPAANSTIYRRLALKSWLAFTAKERRTPEANECHEDDPQLLAALDDARSKANATPGQGLSGQQVRARLQEWISK
jgi:hypothetical protein